MRRKLGCCARERQREISIDFDEHHRITTYNGLETCILNSHSFGNESGTSSGNGCMTDSFDEDDSASSSSITNPLGSFSSLWKDDEEKRQHVISTDVETMKEKFAKLLLGEDVAGGAQGVSTALALSNAITSLAASVFGDLWKLEPLPEERASTWRSEMEWLLSPTKYMVELVPAKQDGASGRTLEIMTPQARRDICMNLPALRKLDSMLTETLESMGDRGFWYGEVGSKSMGWWLPNPKVGVSVMERNRLLHSAKLIYQIFKAAKSINEHVLVEMPVPAPIKDALPKSGKASLGDVLHKILSSESLSPMEMANCVNPNSEHAALLAINRLEAAILAWNQRIAELSSNAKSPVRTRASWFFVKDYSLFNSEPLRLELLVNRAQLLVHHLKIKHPNLPQSFLDVTKIKYGKDVGHSILEAYSRVLSNLAFTILSRIGDILQQDVMSISNSPVAMSQLVPGISGSPMPDRVSLSLVHQHNCVDGKKGHFRDTCEEGKISSACGTPSQSRVW